jgi:hypothetical protein
MAIFNKQNVAVRITPEPPKNTKVEMGLSYHALLIEGFNIPIEISTASHFRRPPINAPLASIVIMAHFDTGASITSIDIGLAKHLKLIAIGSSESRTAQGRQVMPDFAVDISFPNTRLMPFHNLRIGSCDLGFSLEKNMEDINIPQNFGLLIGRDMMSRWNIVWNGTTSAVTICD